MPRPRPPDPAPDPRGRQLAAALLRAGVTVRLRVQGRSMWPSLDDGAEVELAPLQTPPRPGTIVFTDVPGEGQRLHRLLRRRPGGRVQTRGDGCLRPDPPAPAGALIGRLQRVRRRDGSWRRHRPGRQARLLAYLLTGLSGLVCRIGRRRGLARRRVSSPG